MPRVHQFIELTTDAVGQFSFDRIPEGDVKVSRRIDIPLGNRAFQSNRNLTETAKIIAGETATVTITGEVP